MLFAFYKQYEGCVSFNGHYEFVGAWMALKTMLSDENRLLVPLDVRKEFGGLPLEGGNQSGTHGVTLQHHFRSRK